MGEICREQQGIAELEMLCPNSTYYTGVYLCNLAALEDQKHPRHQAEVDLASPVAVLISCHTIHDLQKHLHRSQGSDLSAILRGDRRKKFLFGTKPNYIHLFCLY